MDIGPTSTSVVDDTEEEWNAGTLSNVEAVSNELVLENTAGVYEASGYRYSVPIDGDEIGVADDGGSISWVATKSATNKVSNGDFSDGTTGWSAGGSTLSVAGEILSITGDGTRFNPHTYSDVGLGVEGHKYHVRLRYRVTNSDCNQVRTYCAGTSGVIRTNPTQNTWYDEGIVITGGNTYSKVALYHYYDDNASANGKVLEIDTVMTIDLTDLFGEGFEPSEAECDEIFATWFDGSSDVDDLNVTVEVGINTSNTTPPTSWVEATSGSTIPGISSGTNLIDKYIWAKQTLVGDTTETPSLESVTLTLDGYLYGNNGFFAMIR